MIWGCSGSRFKSLARYKLKQNLSNFEEDWDGSFFWPSSSWLENLPISSFFVIFDQPTRELELRREEINILISKLSFFLLWFGFLLAISEWIFSLVWDQFQKKSNKRTFNSNPCCKGLLSEVVFYCYGPVIDALCWYLVSSSILIQLAVLIMES